MRQGNRLCESGKEIDCGRGSLSLAAGMKTTWMLLLGTLCLLAWMLAGQGGDRVIPLRRFSCNQPISLTLDEAVRIALEQNPSIQVARQEIERSRGQVIEVRAQALPRVELNATYQQQARTLTQPSASTTAGAQAFATPGQSARAIVSSTPVPMAAMAAAAATPTPTPSPTASPSPSPSPSAFPTPPPRQTFVQNKTWVVTLQASQLLYSGGRVRASIRIARLAEDQTIFRLRDTIDTAITTVREQFATVIVNKALIGVQQEQVTVLERQLREQQGRYEAGTVPRYNVLQAEVALANARPALIQARNNHHLAQLQLAKTLGYETRDLPADREPFDVVGELTIPPAPNDLATGLSLAREHRPSLKALRLDILMNVEQITVAASGKKPTLSAVGGYTVENNRLSKNLLDAVDGYFFGIQGSWAVFDGFETKGRLIQARAGLEESRVRYEDAVQQVDLEVQQAWANLRQARETIASQEKNVEQAQEALRLARERLSAGAGTQLDVLSSTVALAQARTTELQARLSYNNALAEFERATGDATRYDETFCDPLTRKKTANAAPSIPSP